MKKHVSIMGMTCVIEIIDAFVTDIDFESVFTYFRHIDTTFSTYKKDSEIEKINRGELSRDDVSSEVREIFRLSHQTKKITNGYFTIELHGRLDPSGIVKGYAIHKAGEILLKKGIRNFFISIGGDVEVQGVNSLNKKWRIGIQNPFQQEEIIKVVYITNKGIATSGSYIRGKHIYDPIQKKSADGIASMTVIGPNIYEADRFATAAFAMGEKGLEFIASLKNFAGYMVTKDKKSYWTPEFLKYTTG